MKRKKGKIAIFILIILFSYVILDNRYTLIFLQQLKAKHELAVSGGDSLYQEIVAKAKEYEIPPENAEIHRVWKKTPGYNGRSVDIDASYKRMKKKGSFDPKLLVFKQIPPSVHLSDLPNEAIYRGHPDKPMVSFLINVAWGNEYIPKMLAVLKKHHVKATFFLEGRWVKENPELAKMIVESGHEIGNHSYSHPDMARLPSARIRQEMEETNKIIKATTGKNVKWFAPPSGSFRKEVVDIAADMNMETIMWSVDTIDWQKPRPETLINRVMSKIHNGAMILMHPTSSTAESLDSLIKKIKEKNLSIGSLSSLLDEKRLD
ncbi:polysaccharide deacetylase family protein [Aeribacillus sp. FSL M8-0254]|uniref:polysaccharide deacetylase family protein n=1 Tax=Aeribacillus sp. FSL M8-0254 TaxID=2954577 RepID=UPI0030F6C490